MTPFALTNVTTAAAAVRELRPAAPPDGPLTFAGLNDTRPLGGGTDVLNEIKDGLIAPRRLVNLKPAAELRGIRLEGDELQIGATTLVHDVAESAEVRRRAPALAQAAGHVGSEQIRHQGTVGGNLCQRPRCWYYRNVESVCLKKGGERCFAVEGENQFLAVFGTDAPCRMVSPTNLGTALLALDGVAHLLTAEQGERGVPIAEFYRLPTAEDPFRETVLHPGEIVREVHVTSQEGRRSAYLQISEKAEFDWALVSGAVSVALDGAGNIADIRLALGAVAPVPWRLTRAEDFLRGKPPTDENLREAARLGVAAARPMSKNAYKLPIARAVVARVIRQALA